MLFLFMKKIKILLIFKDNGEGFLFNFYFVGIINISACYSGIFLTGMILQQEEQCWQGMTFSKYPYPFASTRLIYVFLQKYILITSKVL